MYRGQKIFCRKGVIEKLETGFNLCEVAKFYGVSRQRIHQILVASGSRMMELKLKNPEIYKKYKVYELACRICGKRFFSRVKITKTCSPECRSIDAHNRAIGGKLVKDKVDVSRKIRKAKKAFWKKVHKALELMEEKNANRI